MKIKRFALQGIPLLFLSLNLSCKTLVVDEARTKYIDTSDPRYAKMNQLIDNMFGHLPWFYLIPKQKFETNIPSKENAPYFEYSHLGHYVNGVFTANPIANLGLRVYVMPPDVNRDGQSEYLARQNIVKSGDVLLSFRQGWSGVNGYGHVQLGTSHVGIAIVMDNRVYNIDSPISYTGKLDSPKHYLENQLMLHIIRPNLTDVERKNIEKWGRKLIKNQAQVEEKISFQGDYGSPQYSKIGVELIATIGEIIKNPTTATSTSAYCSEFGWSFLSLKGCDPDNWQTVKSQGCYKKPIFEPMKFYQQEGELNPGLTDGPWLVLNEIKQSLELEKMNELLKIPAVITWDAQFFGNSAPSKMSSGHLKQAELFQQTTPLLYSNWSRKLGYQPSATNKIGNYTEVELADLANKHLPLVSKGTAPNYSPTSYVVNALSTGSGFSYVGTIAFPDREQISALEEQFPDIIKIAREKRIYKMAHYNIEGQGNLLIGQENGNEAVSYGKWKNLDDKQMKKFTQCLLNVSDVDVGIVDGWYGDTTAKAVTELRKKFNLERTSDPNGKKIFDVEIALAYQYNSKSHDCIELCPSCAQTADILIVDKSALTTAGK